MVDAAFSHGAAGRTGVLLINLGTPDEPTAPALRRYLAEFLWDRRVVEIPRPLWWLILHGIILRTRPARSAEKYRTIWTGEGSPLLVFTERLGEALQAACDDLVVAVAMRYGQPSIGGALERLRAAQVRRLLVLPLYPQYSAATTASAFDKVVAELGGWRWLPELRFVTHYHDEPAYIQALAQSIQRAWQQQPPAERLLFSFHGLPKRNLLQGDPYYCECHKTARLVAEALRLPAQRWAVSFQSRFGKAEWLQPYTSEQLKDWAGAGVAGVDVVCPGFSADCLETLEEIEVENREYFTAAGGQRYRYIPALNNSPEHVTVLRAVLDRHLGGWRDAVEPASADLQRSRERALALGASA